MVGLRTTHFSERIISYLEATYLYAVPYKTTKCQKLFVVSPHSEDFYHSFFFINLIDKAVLNIYAP